MPFSSSNRWLSKDGYNNLRSVYETLQEISTWAAYPSIQDIKTYIKERIVRNNGTINSINICCAETLEELKEKYMLGVITNGNADIEKIGISHFFEFNISASQINIGKPDPRIFEEARLKAGLKAEEICHVGDHPINDVEGSYNVGMKPIWFNEKKEDWPLENKPEYKEVSHWSELPETILSF